MPAFKDDHVLMIAPGSQTTLAQLGLPESFTPARLRLPTRMFPGSKKGEWEPYRVVEKRVKKSAPENRPAGAAADGPARDQEGDATMEDGPKDEETGPNGVTDVAEDEIEIEYEEDLDTDEGAVYPLRQGSVKDWPCFLALLTHIHNTLSPPFHTPILLVTEPAWTSQDQETVTQFCFEKFKTPAFCLIDSALAICYAMGVSLATVVDVGFEKCDVTAVIDFLVHDVGRGIAIPACGGEAMTQRLLQLLGPDGWTRDMCEQLKKSHICEVLPKDVPLPELTDADSHDHNASQVGAGPRPSIAEQGGVSNGAGLEPDLGDVDDPAADLKAVESNEGVLDVASIVASGKTAEYLARKEREKAEKAAKKAGDAAAAAAAARPARLPNARRPKNTFIYEERRRHRSNTDEHRENEAKAVVEEDHAAGQQAKAVDPPEAGTSITTGTDAAQDQPAAATVEETEASRRQQERAARKDEKRRAREAAAAAGETDVLRREVEVGLERFKAADAGILETIADAVHRTIMSVEEVSKRAELWDSLIIVGNGSKVRGFKDALISTLTSKYLISPSSATIFTSELPSALSTPLATGANTPQLQPQGPGGGGGGGSGGPTMTGNSSSHVNPLLLAATTASNPHLNAALHHQHNNQQQQSSSSVTLSTPATPGNTTTAGNQPSSTTTTHSSHGQTPTSIKLAKIPEYFPEWKEVGYEEAVFLGAQVAAKVIFVVDQGLSKGFMTRLEYNEVGPVGIHDSSL